MCHYQLYYLHCVNLSYTRNRIATLPTIGLQSDEAENIEPHRCDFWTAKYKSPSREKLMNSQTDK